MRSTAHLYPCAFGQPRSIFGPIWNRLTNKLLFDFVFHACHTNDFISPPTPQPSPILQVASQINSILIIHLPSIDWRAYGSINIIFSFKRAFNYAPVTFQEWNPSRHGPKGAFGLYEDSLQHPVCLCFMICTRH